MAESQFAYLIATAGYGINMLILIIVALFVSGISWIATKGCSVRDRGERDKR